MAHKLPEGILTTVYTTVFDDIRFAMRGFL